MVKKVRLARIHTLLLIAKCKRTVSFGIGCLGTDVTPGPGLFPSQVKDIFAFQIDGKDYTLDLKKEGKLHEGKPKGLKPCCTMIMSEAVFVDLFTGKMNAQKGFMQGKYKIKGNIMASQKLSALMGK